MGDVRFQRPYRQVAEAADRLAAIQALADEDLIAAVVTAALEGDPYLANVLASEAQNRIRQKATIVETSSEGLLCLDTDGRVTYANPAAGHLLGVDCAELRSVPLHRTIHENEAGEPLDCEPCAIIAALEGHPVTRQETPLRRWDGSIFMGELTTAPILRDNVVDGAILTFRDVTERKAAEEARRQLAAIVETTDDAIILFTPDGTVLAWNPSAERIYGYSAAEMVGRPIFPLTPPDRVDEGRWMWEVLHRGEAIRNLETQRLTKDGRLLDVAITASPLRDGTGAIVAVSGISRDITERKRKDRLVEYQSSLLEAQLEAAPSAMVVVDPAGRLASYNRRFVEMWGFPEEVLAEGLDEAALAWVTGRVRDPEGFIARVRQIYREQPEEAHDEVELRDGRTFERHGKIVRGPRGHVYGWLWAYHDITGRSGHEAPVPGTAHPGSTNLP